MASWPNLHKVAVAYLKVGTNHRVATRVPDNLEAVLPLHRVIRGPGSDDGITDSPLLDVETFAANEDDAWTAAETVRELLHDLAGRAVNGALVDTVTTDVGPVALDYGNPSVFRVVASYRIALRKRP